MSQEDETNRWYRYLMGGKSSLQRQLEKELEERRAREFKPKRAPLKWYWWVLIVLGLGLWTALAFWTDGRFA